MNSFFNTAKKLAIALVSISAALLQPMAHAQSPASSGNESMPGGKAHSSSMPGGSMGMKDMKGMKDMDMQAMMKDNNEKMSGMKMTGNADVDFAMMMRVHHQGAIDMAQAQLRNGKSPEMRKMSNSIIAAQKKEIGQLDRFLAKNGHAKNKMTQ